MVPLALWVAWTPSVFLLVLAVGAVSIVLLGFLASRLPSRDDDSHGRDDAQDKPVLPDGFVEELHAIYPLTYHHARIGRSRFRHTMERLRRLIR